MSLFALFLALFLNGLPAHPASAHGSPIVHAADSYGQLPNG